MKVRFLSVAEQELAEAIQYYEKLEEGLGLRFYSEIRNAIDRIVAFPSAWYPIGGNSPRCRTKVFPYGVIYELRKDEILITSISCLHRDPKSWKDR